MMPEIVREKVYFMAEDPELLHMDRAEESGRIDSELAAGGIVSCLGPAYPIGMRLEETDRTPQ